MQSQRKWYLDPQGGCTWYDQTVQNSWPERRVDNYDTKQTPHAQLPVCFLYWEYQYLHDFWKNGFVEMVLKSRRTKIPLVDLFILILWKRTLSVCGFHFPHMQTTNLINTTKEPEGSEPFFQKGGETAFSDTVMLPTSLFWSCIHCTFHAGSVLKSLHLQSFYTCTFTWTLC